MKSVRLCWLVSGLVLIFLLTNVGLVSGQVSGETADEVEELDFGDFEVVNTETEDWTLTKLTGRMHPAAVHIPIAWMMLVLLVDSLTLIFKQEWLNRSGAWLLTLTFFGFVPALITGFLNLSSHDVPSQLALNHRNMALLALGLCLVAVSIRLLKRNTLTGTMRWIYLVIVFAATAVIGLTGHLGGKLVFGENYLPF